MKVEQIYSILNTVTGEITGKTGLLREDLSNLSDLGTEVFGASSVDNYVKSLVNHIGKVVFVDRVYNGSVPSIMMDSWEFGSVLQKVSCEIPDAVENESWELENGKTYNPNIFYKPVVSSKFFNNKLTFEINCSFIFYLFFNIIFKIFFCYSNSTIFTKSFLKFFSYFYYFFNFFFL